MAGRSKRTGAPGTERGRSPSGVPGAGADMGRWSSRRKMEAVLRVLKGEALDGVSRSLKISTTKLAAWRDEFLEAGQCGLRAREPDHRDERIRELHAKIGEGVEWAVHACVLLAVVPEGKALPAAKLAEYHELPPAYLAKQLQALAAAGLVASVPGRRGGYRLARDPETISLLNIVEAAEGDSRRTTCILRGGPCGIDGTCRVHGAFYAAQEALLAELAGATLASLTRAEPWSPERAHEAAG